MCHNTADSNNTTQEAQQLKGEGILSTSVCGAKLIHQTIFIVLRNNTHLSFPRICQGTRIALPSENPSIPQGIEPSIFCLSGTCSTTCICSGRLAIESPKRSMTQRLFAGEGLWLKGGEWGRRGEGDHLHEFSDKHYSPLLRAHTLSAGPSEHFCGAVIKCAWKGQLNSSVGEYD